MVSTQTMPVAPTSNTCVRSAKHQGVVDKVEMLGLFVAAAAAADSRAFAETDVFSADTIHNGCLVFGRGYL